MTGVHALDAMNALAAAMQTAFGPFLAVALGAHGWSPAQIGVALSISTIAVLVSQLPAGAFVDAARDPRAPARMAVLGLGLALLVLAVWPRPGPVFVAMALQGVSSSLLGPAIAATSLALVGRAALGERLGRNARYASIGNGLAAAMIGLVGGTLATGTVMVAVAVLALPALFAVSQIRNGFDHHHPAAPDRQTVRQEITALLRNPHLTIFAFCVGAFQLANAAMLPLAAAGLSRAHVKDTELIVAVAIVMPQIVVALCAPAIGRYAETHGRRPLLLLGWGSVPVQGLLLALLPTPWLLPGVQMISGIGAAVLGVMLPLVAADLSHGTRRFTLCLSALNLPIAIGATLSTTLSGFFADRFGDIAAFLGLGLAGASGLMLLWLAMPETRPVLISPMAPEPAR